MSYERAIKNRKEELIIMKKSLKKAKEEKKEERIKDLQRKIDFLNKEIAKLQKQIKEE